MSEQPSPLTPSTRELSIWLSRWNTAKPSQIRVRTLLSRAVALALGTVLFVVPMPYVVESPGPTLDVGGSYKGKGTLSVSGANSSSGGALYVDVVHEKGDGNGELRMVTVSEQSDPGRRLNLMRLINASLSETSQLIPYSTAYPNGVAMDQVDTAQSQMMKSSQSSADIAALEALGWAVPAAAMIRGAAEGSDAAERVRDDDTLLSITDEVGVVYPADNASMVSRLAKQTLTGSILVLRVMRDGEQVELEVKTTPDEFHPQGSCLGTYLDVALRFPLDVQVSLELVDGPSAGLVFLLVTIDKLTPGNLTGDHIIAATGTMSYNNEVEPIGGIVQEMHGAKRDGSEWFLVPVLSCDGTVGSVPEDLSAVAVITLGEARETTETIAANQAGKLTSRESVAGASWTLTREYSFPYSLTPRLAGSALRLDSSFSIEGKQRGLHEVRQKI